MPLDRYKTEDPFENHPLFKTEEQARIEETMDGEEPAVAGDAPLPADLADRGARADGGRALEPVARFRLGRLTWRRIGRLRLIALGAALAYFFDPENGKARRKATVKRSRASRGRQRAEGLRPHAAGRGAKDEARPPRGHSKGLSDDVTLARNVESEIFRDAESGEGPRRRQRCKVVLSGEADSPELIDELVGKARKVQGVEEVESLLHTPAEPGPPPEYRLPAG